MHRILGVPSWIIRCNWNDTEKNTPGLRRTELDGKGFERRLNAAFALSITWPRRPQSVRQRKIPRLRRNASKLLYDIEIQSYIAGMNLKDLQLKLLQSRHIHFLPPALAVIVTGCSRAQHNIPMQVGNVNVYTTNASRTWSPFGDHPLKLERIKKGATVIDTLAAQGSGDQETWSPTWGSTSS
eukprot:14758246-Heterocapsa_arctica.AAC.1